MATQFQIVEAATAAALKTAVDVLLAAGWTVVGFQVDANPLAASGAQNQPAERYYAALTK